MTRPRDRRMTRRLRILGLASLLGILFLGTLLVGTPSWGWSGSVRVQAPAGAVVPAGSSLLLIYHDSSGYGTAILSMQAAGEGVGSSAAGSAVAFDVTLIQNGATFQGSGTLISSAEQSLPISFKLAVRTGDAYQYSGTLSQQNGIWFGGGTYQGAQATPSPDEWTVRGLLLSAAAGPSFPAWQAALAPSVVGIAPEGFAVFFASSILHPPDGSGGSATSDADQPSLAADDGSAITLLAPAGLIVVPDGDCAPFGALTNAVSCSSGQFITFETISADSTAEPLPQTSSLAPNTRVALVAAAAPDTPATAAPAIVVVRSEPECCSQPAPIDLTWDGQTLTLGAPAGYRVLAVDSTGCSSGNQPANPLICPLTGVPPRLLVVAAEGPTQHPPATPPDFLTALQIAAPTRAEPGQSISFSASARGLMPSVQPVYLWSFGDGNLAIGETVSHTYATPGLYTIRLITLVDSRPFTGGKGYATTSTGVELPVGDVSPPSVTYPAGWNLIDLPQGTLLSGTSGPLYALPAPFDGACGTSYTSVPAGRAFQTVATSAASWAYFATPTTLTLPLVVPPHPGELVGGEGLLPGCFALLGNPTEVPVHVSGADAVYSYDPTTGSYRQTDTLQPGQGAWVYSSSASGVNLTATP